MAGDIDTPVFDARFRGSGLCSHAQKVLTLRGAVDPPRANMPPVTGHQADHRGNVFVKPLELLLSQNLDLGPTHPSCLPA
jgi:hypothetical protein